MGIGNAFRRAVGLEVKEVRRVSPADEKDSRIFSRVLGLGPSHAGKAVTVDTALQLSAVWGCVKLTSETVATLPLMVYRRHPNGGREVAGEHPLYALLHDEPNADQTSVEFWEGVVLSLLLNGNAFAEKVRRGDGVLIALQPMAFDKVTVRRLPEGDLEYRFNDRGRVRVLYEDDVFHVRAFGNGGILGLSPISYARHSLGTAMAADEAAGKMFANGVRPSAALQMDGILKPEQRKDIRDNIVGPITGSANAGSVFVLEGGMKFTPISLSPKDAEMATARRWHVEDICRWFGTPPILIGHASEGQTMWGTGVGQIKQGWYTLGLRPLLRRIEAAIQRSLIAPEERQIISAEFVVEGFLRADSEKRYDLYAKAAQNGIRTRNEIRELENLPRIDGGDELTVQSNLLPLHMLGQTPPSETPTSDDPAEDEDETDQGGGSSGRRPFDEAKAFDPSKHPRDGNGQFRGAGGSGRRMSRLVRQTLAALGFRDDVDLGRVSGARFSGAAGRDVDGWRFGASSEFVRHIDKRHGPKSGDRSPVRAKDYENLPRVLGRGTVTRGTLTKSQGLQTVVVTHRTKGATYRAVLAVRKRSRSLTLHSFTKRVG